MHVLTRAFTVGVECDTFISPLSESEFRLAESFETLTENDITFQRHLYRHRNVQELQYLNLIQEILQSGDRRSDRTGVGTSFVARGLWLVARGSWLVARGLWLTVSRSRQEPCHDLGARCVSTCATRFRC